MTNEKIVTVFKAFSDESRVKILGLLKDGEMCGNAILSEMQIGQSTLSHHMKLLVESGIVSARKDGKWTYYSINKEGGEVAKSMIDEMMDAKEVKAAPQPGSAKAKTVVKKKTTVKKAESTEKEIKETVVKPEPRVEVVKEVQLEEPKKVEVKKEEPKKEAPVRRRQMDTFLL